MTERSDTVLHPTHHIGLDSRWQLTVGREAGISHFTLFEQTVFIGLDTVCVCAYIGSCCQTASKTGR